ncbi:MAG: basic amino acid ABC transporter substrate-binding protein [Cyanobacteria bacterium]|nr:basic amino acid ABC transporter substrate-binding protein [Cyanobacteriota bacterium]MDA0865643.1 basic amino acid ABC transporter substrate-binding protein [Cyanobacteriota bacterium]
MAIACRRNSDLDPVRASRAAGKLPLKVATDPDFPPFEFSGENGKLAGFDIDLMLAIGQVAGLDIQYESLPFDSLIPALQSGTVNAAISAITITPDRAKTVDFSSPYFKVDLAISVRQETNGIDSLEDLKGKKIAVQLDTTGAEKAADIPDADIRTFYSAPLPLQALVDGTVDAVINDAPVIRFAIAAENITGLKILAAFPAETFYGIALPKGSQNLAPINTALATLMANGTYADIYRKWFNTDPPQLPESASAPNGVRRQGIPQSGLGTARSMSRTETNSRKKETCLGSSWSQRKTRVECRSRDHAKGGCATINPSGAEATSPLVPELGDSAPLARYSSRQSG